MTLCLAQSLVDHAGRFVLRDQVEKYIAWFEDGYLSSTGRCFDIGNATRLALEIWRDCLRRGANAGEEEEEDVEVEAQGVVDGSLKGEQRCGNGSLMRTAPIALVYFREERGVVDGYTARAGQVTHPHETCVEACLVYVRLLCAVLRREGLGVERGKEALFGVLKDYDFKAAPLRSRFAKYRSLEDLQRVEESEISSSGFVVDTLEAALWAFFLTETFRDGALKVVNLGDDADTVGAVYGGLAGAFYGIEGLPGEWIQGLQAKYMVDRVVEGVVALAEEKVKGLNG